ncbi:hypothetical protein SAMN05216504_4159 [Pseudomonas sp. A214]|nr:hypothetical protein SAMN05216504_4159 [Pseudomonas sp. A214]
MPATQAMQSFSNRGAWFASKPCSHNGDKSPRHKKRPGLLQYSAEAFLCHRATLSAGLCLHRRNRRQHANQKGQCQKTTQKNRHLRHEPSWSRKLRYTGGLIGKPPGYSEVGTGLITAAALTEKYGSDETRRTVPHDRCEVSRRLSFSPLQRFVKLELPFATLRRHCLQPLQNQLAFAPFTGSRFNASTLINTITAPTTTITDGRSASTKEAINIAVGGIR